MKFPTRCLASREVVGVLLELIPLAGEHRAAFCRASGIINPFPGECWCDEFDCGMFA